MTLPSPGAAVEAVRDASAAELRSAYRRQRRKRDWFNFALLKHRHCDGFMASMHQSGTHWLKHMLAVAIAARYGLPPPQFIHSDDIIGGPRDRPPPPPAPNIRSTHSIAHPWVASSVTRGLLGLPRYVVLVRDIRASLVSNYEKWKARYECEFDEFLYADPTAKRFNSDLWWCLRFCNAWGEVARRQPAHTLVVRYEDLQADPLTHLQRVSTFLELDLSDALLQQGVADSSKEKMQDKQDKQSLTVVRHDSRPVSAWFDAPARSFVQRASRELLRHDFGYDYSRWD